MVTLVIQLLGCEIQVCSRLQKDRVEVGSVCSKGEELFCCRFEFMHWEAEMLSFKDHAV